ncbi:MAG: dCTP deaminase, partial [Yoonia sp.]
MTTAGVLADHQIRDMIAQGRIASDAPITEGQIQPASLDLRLGATAFRVRASFLAGRTRSVKERLADFQMHAVELDG